MTKEELKEFYNNDVDFREYITCYFRKTYKIDPEGALGLKIVRNVAERYLRWRKVNEG